MIRTLPSTPHRSSPHKLQEFYSRSPNKPRLPKYLDKWMECWHSKDDKLPEEHKDKNAPWG